MSRGIGHIACMLRRARSIASGLVYHVLNRANGWLRLFKKEADFAAFEAVLAEPHERAPFPRLAPAAGTSAGVGILTLADAHAHQRRFVHYLNRILAVWIRVEPACGVVPLGGHFQIAFLD